MLELIRTKSLLCAPFLVCICQYLFNDRWVDPRLLAFLAPLFLLLLLGQAAVFFATLVLYFRLAYKMEIPFHDWEHGSIFGIVQHGGILPSLCGKYLHNKHLYHIDSPWHDGCYFNWRVPHQIYENYFESSSSSNLYVGI